MDRWKAFAIHVHLSNQVLYRCRESMVAKLLTVPFSHSVAPVHPQGFFGCFCQDDRVHGVTSCLRLGKLRASCSLAFTAILLGTCEKNRSPSDGGTCEMRKG